MLYVRDNSAYGKNSFINNEDGTITDQATGLMWMQNDNGLAIAWEDALSYAESYSYAGYSDWRLPDIKELQSILDYTRSPETTNSAAIDPAFNCTQITNEAGNADYAWYWSNTTFCSQTPTKGNNACYMSFGRAMGYMSNLGGWIDVHGAGAQRSDPKTGDPADWPTGFGPQGDAVRINNYVRLVRNVETITGINKTDNKYQLQIYPNPATDYIKISYSRIIETITIYSIQGIKVMELNLGAKNTQLNVSQLTSGIYFIMLTDDLGQRFSQKIVVNK